MDVLNAPFIYVVLGYLSGSVLYSELFMRVFHGKSLMEVSENHNPGSSNAFIYGGAITLELESYITDRIVLLANVRERVLWGGSLGKFSTQFGLGIKFIIN